MRPIGEFLMMKGDPIGQFLGRLLLKPFVQMLWPTAEEQRRELEIIQKTDPLRRLVSPPNHLRSGSPCCGGQSSSLAWV